MIPRQPGPSCARWRRLKCEGLHKRQERSRRQPLRLANEPPPSPIPCHRCRHRRRRRDSMYLCCRPLNRTCVIMSGLTAISHERAVGDFTTALALIRRKQTGEGFDGSRLRETCSAADLLQDNDEGPGGNGDDAAASTTTEHKEIGGGGDGGDDNERPRTPDERCAPSTAPGASVGGVAAQNQPRLAEPGHQAESRGEDGRSKISRGDTSRRRSQGADGGDGMAEGGSVLGACHYAR